MGEISITNLVLRTTALLPLALSQLRLLLALLRLLLRWLINDLILVVLCQVAAEHLGEVIARARNTLVFVSRSKQGQCRKARRRDLTSFLDCACIINNSGLSKTIAASLLCWICSYESPP